MDNYDNFFNDVNGGNAPRTPLYHTPDNDNKPDKKTTRLTVLFVIIALLMCLIAVVNVVVLAVLKDDIAANYTAQLQASIRQEYENAIADYIADKNISEDIKNTVEADVLNKFNTTAAEIAGTQTILSTAVITASSGTQGATASGFLISDRNEAKGITTRYLVTNAHAVLYEKASSSSPFGFNPTYSFQLYDTITCTFLNDNTTYKLEVVALGAYKGDYVTSSEYQSKPDLAILAFTDKQPDETAHPSLKIASSDYASFGDEIAIVGNPAGVGLSVSSGCISHEAREIVNWGYGKFYMTDAAINGGNSGGPMVNRNGVVVGVVESKLQSEEIENMGFAVAASTLVEFIENSQLAANNRLGKNITIPYLTQGIVS